MALTNPTPLMARAQNEDVTDDDTDPAARPTRGTFTIDEKLRILAAYEKVTGPGAKGAHLRRQGIYSSQITEWRRARDAGTLGALDPKSTGLRQANDKEVARLKKKNERLEAELAKTKTALDIMGKVHALLEDISKSADTNENETR
jgi:transposase-like protein